MTYRPWLGRTVGIEMEMNTTTTAGATLSEQAIREAIAPVVGRRLGTGRGYFHSNGRTWDVKSDGSCGWEVASPALTLDDEGDNAELRGVCDALTNVRPMVNRQCGLHVHVDCRDFNWDDMRRLIALWARYEPFFFSLCPPSRRRNQYCAPVRRTEWAGQDSGNWSEMNAAINASTETEFARHARTSGRYTALNTSGWWTNGRVEFRLHSGTVNYVKIRNWTKLLCAIVARAKHPDMPRVSKVTAANRDTAFNTYYVCKVLGLIPSRYIADVPASNAALVAWVEARRRQFDPASRPLRGARAALAGNDPATDAPAEGGGIA